MKKFLIGLALIVGSTSTFAWGDREQGALAGAVIGYVLGQANSRIYASAPVYVPPPVYVQPAPRYHRPPVVYYYDGRYQLPPPNPPGYYSQQDYYDPNCDCNVRIYR